MLSRSCCMFSTTHETLPWSSSTHPISQSCSTSTAASGTPSSSLGRRGEIVVFMAVCSNRTNHRKLPKNLSNPRRSKLPPDMDYSFKRILYEDADEITQQPTIDTFTTADEEIDEELEVEVEETIWESDEMEAISSLFKGRIPQKPGKLNRERPLPLPLPYKIRPLGLPTPKRFSNVSRQSISKQVYKNPTFLIGLAKEIQSLSTEENVSKVLSKWGPFLRKGSLSLTIRELGYLGLPERALQTFCWVKKQPHLFPDDHVLASTIEVLAGSNELKVPFDLDKFTGLASRSVYEAMLRGFIKGGSLKLALKLLSIAKGCNRVLGTGVYAKLILELGKDPDKSTLVLALLEELAVRDDLDLTPQDCTAIMKICIRLGRFEIVEGLYDWFRKSGGNPSVVMYTTLIHCRYSANKYREALAMLWEMEASNCLFDLPAYRVVIKLFVALDDVSRAVRYFSKLKEAGFRPTFDIYCSLIKIYMASGRLAKCEDIRKEAEMAGFRLNEHTMSKLQQ
ncbi:pentatricopeptide repeat-containing protein At2g01860 [Nicotiana sylvestris]|uniref:Pentatricopeptide repeat-containing protein At2g01860 n=1 Tax=Nicotiana sylvestris TaxID=4096 RepID=A0A1U7WCB0_NICSY|nr:PREDICTED: pentatricopeptide repeat-containing protein At2g01860 [Nicotiana sylvestris]